MLESDISKERRISKTPRNCSISAKDLGEFFECSGLQLLGDLSHLKKGLEDMDCFSLLPSLAGRNLEVVALSLSRSYSLRNLELTLASEALHAGYDYDEKVYAAAKAVDVGMIEYDSDDNLIIVDEKKIEPIPPLDHSSIDYEPFNKDFYKESTSISGMSELDVTEYRKSLAIRVSGFDVPKPIKKHLKTVDPIINYECYKKRRVWEAHFHTITSFASCAFW
ncbi:hypothetical protein VNO77_42818 [Canavalia gladiata]|uniref:Uncharacterized protein n=1 Tax=Canavalia gladiata TaxID=3824 RepID=A0AAN9PNX4_CANGL